MGGSFGLECGLDVGDLLREQETAGDAAEAERLVEVGHRLVGLRGDTNAEQSRSCSSGRRRPTT